MGKALKRDWLQKDTTPGTWSTDELKNMLGSLVSSVDAI